MESKVEPMGAVFGFVVIYIILCMIVIGSHVFGWILLLIPPVREGMSQVFGTPVPPGAIFLLGFLVGCVVWEGILTTLDARRTS